MHISMTEAALDSLLKAFYHINSCCQAKNDNRGFLCLSNVEQIVE
jgi:hypothetical protein